MNLPDTSPPGSFKGWLFTTWVYENRAFLKNAISLWGGVVATLTALDETSLLLALGATGMLLFTVGSKLAVDAVHFWLAGVELRK